MSDIMSAFTYDVKPEKTMRDPGNCSNPTQTKSKPEYFLMGNGWTLIGSSTFLKPL